MEKFFDELDQFEFLELFKASQKLFARDYRFAYEFLGNTKFDSIMAIRNLATYFAFKASATKLRLLGCIQDAIGFEKLADSLYRKLPNSLQANILN